MSIHPECDEPCSNLGFSAYYQRPCCSGGELWRRDEGANDAYDAALCRIYLTAGAYIRPLSSSA
jgi:hypothetical protein